MLQTVAIFQSIVSFCVLNVRSARNKVGDIYDEFSEKKLDFMVATEFWLKPSDPDYHLQVKDFNDLKFSNRHRPRRQGGGIATIHRKSFNVNNVLIDFKPKSFEYGVDCVNHGKFAILSIYRPPALKHRILFLEELDGLLSILVGKYKRLLLCGDINLHFENPTDNFSRKFLDLITDYGFEYHIDGQPTHEKGGSLDVVCSLGLKCVEFQILDNQFSDHFPIYFQVCVPGKQMVSSSAPLEIAKRYSFRDYKQLESEECKSYFQGCFDFLQGSNLGTDELACSFVESLNKGLDEFAPSSVRKSRKQNRSKFVYDKEVAEAKQVRRQLERKVRSSNSEIAKQMLKAQRYKVRKLAQKSQAMIIRNKLKNGNAKQLFSTVKSLSVPVTRTLPSGYADDKSMAEAFADFFSSKISDIVSHFDTTTANYADQPTTNGAVCFDEFELLCQQDVSALRKVKCTPSVDVLPQTQFASFFQSMLPVIQMLLNSSLSAGVFPSCFKQSQIAPLLKSRESDPDVLNSYRPVSNLPFVSKIIETAVSNQFLAHLDNNQLLNPYQSAYRKGHSVESAFQHVYSSILHELDRGRSVFLVLIDLSAAFDTISHTHLISLLRTHFNVGGNVLKWFKSYLESRTFRVRVGNDLSDPRPLNVGVPQGSVLGPVLFNCIMSLLPPVLKGIGISSHLYADDTQFWVSFDDDPDAINNEATARRRICKAFSLISSFMKKNQLKLNASKTMFIPFSRRRDASLYPPLRLDEDTVIPPKTKLRNLGVIMDSKLSFDSHIRELRKSCFFQLRRLKSIREYIPTSQFASLIHSFITSRIDFCNSLYFTLPDYARNQIQTIQNSCAKCLTGARRFDSATSALRSLHWLPVKARAQFKVLLFAYRIVHKSPNTPMYLLEQLYIPERTRVTRSSRKIILACRLSSQLSTVGGRSLFTSMVDLWNSLPVELQSVPSLSGFKSKLKTYLFRMYFES